MINILDKLKDSPEYFAAGIQIELAEAVYTYMTDNKLSVKKFSSILKLSPSKLTKVLKADADLSLRESGAILHVINAKKFNVSF